MLSKPQMFTVLTATPNQSDGAWSFQVDTAIGSSKAEALKNFGDAYMPEGARRYVTNDKYVQSLNNNGTFLLTARHGQKADYVSTANFESWESYVLRESKLDGELVPPQYVRTH